MDIKLNEGEIILEIPSAMDGKFRFKTREDNLGFGDTFAARQENFHEKVYLEWQIGYDILVSDVKSGSAKTKLDKKSFVGSNGKSKYPFELSELVYYAIKENLISKKELLNLLDEVNSYVDFIDKTKINIDPHKSIEMNGIQFDETTIKLPALFMSKTTDGTQVEIHTKQQQYASGTQPMIYFCVPLMSFSNGKNLLSRPSTRKDKLIYKINKENVSILINLLKIFAMASERHKKDISEIIGLIIKQT